MCLDRVLPKKESDKIIQQAKKRGYIRVYKVCSKDYYSNRGKTGTFFGSTYKSGLRKAIGYKKYKNAGWYAFLTKRAARRYNYYNHIKICYAKPQWIKRLGKYVRCGEAGIFTHLAFPDWDKGTMTVREFRQMCKEYKGK